MPSIVVQGCHIDNDFPQECVLDFRRPDMCLHADGLARREQCRWWREQEAADESPRQPAERASRP